MPARNLLGDLVDDVRYAIRQLRRSPGFAAVAIVTVALGIGANSAVFSVLDGVILKPLPYAAPERLVNITTAFPGQDFDRFWVSPPEFYELREWNEVFDEVGGYRIGTGSIETDDRPLRVPSAVATWTLFPTLGVAPVLGRAFTEEEDRMGVAPVAMISLGLWERAFAADPAILGRTVRVGGEATTIVGVLPEGFDLEDAGVDLWTPLNRAQNVDPNDHANRRGNHFINVIGRLSDGVTLERAAADLDRLEMRWPEEYGTTHAISAEGHPITATNFVDDAYGEVRATILLLMGAVSFVLLIACANVASLLLAKSERRTGEVAVRVAMGAGRGRLTRQLLTEGVILGILGGGVGLLLGRLAIGAILRVNPDGVPRTAEIGLNGTVVAFTLLIAVATGVLFGLAPLLSTTLARVGSTLKAGGTRTTRGTSAVRVRRGLVVAEIGLAVILLTGSGLLLRSILALQNVDAGFEPEGVLTAQLSLPTSGYPENTDVGAFYGRLLDRLRALPGVVAATATSALPPVQTLNANDTEFEGFVPRPDGPSQNVDYWTGIEADFLEAMGVEIVEGRGFEPADAGPDAPVMLVNERLAELFYPGESAVGRRIRPFGYENWLVVVGVVENLKQSGLDGEVGTELYFYHPQVTQLGLSYRTMYLVLRTTGDPTSLAPSVERVVRELDASLPVSDVRTMEENVARSMAAPRFLTLLLGLFAGVALLLAGVGTYSVMAYTVAERTREIGIRMAIGAEAGKVRALVLRQGGMLAAIGVAVGVLGSLALTRFLASRLYEIQPTDLATFIAAPLFLTAVALVASYLPAVRASRMDPVAALRED
ncbi:MAG: ABC transporter permease [Gemmatimonadota bacterium]